METEKGGYLEVPKADFGGQRRSRSKSDERLLPTTIQVDRGDHTAGQSLTRFPSIRLPPIADVPPIPPRATRPAANQYAPVSPIDEGEDDISDAVSLHGPLGSETETPLSPTGPVGDFGTPVWLRRSVLVLFALLFTVLLIAILVLWVLSQDRNGFHVGNSIGHQGWAYVPTILMVIIVALWRQVDHHCKSLIPWDELQDGPVASSKSLLLDYISPFRLVSLFEALLHGHIPIVATIVSFILLKVIIIFSTGVVIQLPTTVTINDFPMIKTTEFTASSFSPTSSIDINNSSATAVYSYSGHLVQNLPLQLGVTSNLAYAPLSFDTILGTDEPENATFIGQTDAFIPMMNCHPIEAELNSPHTISQSDTQDAYGLGNLTLSLPVGDICSNSSSVSIPTLNPQTQITPERQVSGILQAIYCSNDEKDQAYASNGPAALLYTVTEILYQQELFRNASEMSGGLSTIAANSSRTIRKTTNVVCIPSYMIGRVDIRNDTTRSINANKGVTISVANDAQSRTLENLSNWNMTSLFTTLVSASSGLFGGNETGDSNERASRSLFTLMALHYGSQELEVLLDPEMLTTAAEATYRGIMAQYAHLSLTSSRNEAVAGTAIYIESRYHVNDISAFLMVAGFAVAAVSSILLLFKGPRAVTPQDPNCVAFHATVLARSHELNRLLQQGDVPTSNNQKSMIQGFEFGTAIATKESGRADFKIVTTEDPQDGIGIRRNVEQKWFRPITSTIPFVAIVILAPVGLIIGLEFLQRASRKNQGIMTVTDDKTTDLYTHYIPALVMIIVASLVNLVDFNIALFAPWSKLSKGNTTHRNGMTSCLLGKSPPFAFVEAFRTRNYAAILSITAAVLASILPVISVGLFNVEPRPSVGADIQLRQLDTFNLSWSNSFSRDNGAAAVVDRGLQENLSYPDFTFGELVFPSFSIDPSSTLQTDAIIGTTSAVLPALRASLRCDIIANVAVNVTTSRANETTYGLDLAFINVLADLPGTCRLGGPQSNRSSFGYNLAIPLPDDGSPTYGAAQIDLLFGNGSSTYGNAGEAGGHLIEDNPPVGCPSLAFVYGKFQLDSASADEVTTMVCYQQIESLDTNVTLYSNTTTIDPKHPPTVNESSAILQVNPLSVIESKSFDFRIQENIARQMTDLPVSTTNDHTTFDHFFDAVLFNPGFRPLDPGQLLGSENYQNFFQAVQHFYRIYMAQAINANMRQNFTASSIPRGLARRQSSPTNVLATTSTTKFETRLVQHNSIRLTLQILLGLIALLTLIAYLLSHTRHILPCNPASIVGTMSLLAGSDLCYSEDESICECCGKLRQRSFGSFMNTPNMSNPAIHYASGGLASSTLHNPPSSGLAIRTTDEDSTSIIATDPDELDHYNPDFGLRRKQLIPDGIEWYTAEHFKLSFAGHRYSMGWWRAQTHMSKKRRYGVDIGMRADGDDDKEWELGEKKIQRNGEEGFMVLSGRQMRDDLDGRGSYAHPGSSGGDSERGMGIAGHTRNTSFGHGGSPAPIHRKPVAGRGLREA